MGFNRFSLALAVRLFVIMVMLGVLGWLLVTPGYPTATLLVFLIVASLSWEVFRFVSRTNQELSRFLDATRYADFGQRFELGNLGAGFGELGDTFTHILDRFRYERQEQEQELRHVKAMLEHVPVPLISITSDGVVTLWNNAARRLFGSQTPTQVAELATYGQEFSDRLVRSSAGDRFLVLFNADGMEQRLTVSVSELQVANRSERLISLQNIQSELDGVQLTAWQDLVRVLTHEIMNSITPVASLAKTAVDLVDDVSGKVAGQPELVAELSDARDAVGTVARRSDSLMDFVTSYRQMTRLPAPERKDVTVRDLFDDVSRVLSAEWPDIEVTVHLESENLKLNADLKMIEQVLINLVRNAAQALTGVKDPLIELRGAMNRRGHVVIEVSDNGPGVPEDVVDRIFVPFFTTRRDGSGVGLALSRQIMIAHGGMISYSTTVGGGARFTLVF